MNSVKSIPLLLACVVLMNGPACGEIAASTPGDARLIGTWQEGLAPAQAKLSAADIAHLDLQGGAFKFDANHTFAMYPPCGKASDKMHALGLQFYPGHWQLLGPEQLLISVQARGAAHEMTIDLSFRDEQLFMTMNGETKPYAKGAIQLPPTCSAAPVAANPAHARPQ